MNAQQFVMQTLCGMPKVRISKWATLAPAALLTILLSACTLPMAAPPAWQPQADATPSPAEIITLAGTEWLLTSLDGRTPLEGVTITLDFFPDNYLEGDAGCNRYGSNYTRSTSDFRVSVIHKTDLDCDVSDSVRQQEMAYLQALASIAAYRATADHLEFDNASGKTILIFARKLPPAVDPALRDTEWVLVLWHGRGPLEGSRITLNLDQEGFGGFAGCNQYGGEYEAADAGILLTSSIWLTAAGCETPALQEQEQAYIEMLSRAATYNLDGDRLEIGDAGGDTLLVFERHPEMAMNPFDLLHTTWRLISADGESPLEGPVITLAFHNGRLAGGHAGCNDYLATYQAAGDDMRFLYLGMLGADCQAEALQVQQDRYTTFLSETTDYRHIGGRLELHTRRGQALAFEPFAHHAGLEGPTWSLMAIVESEETAQEMAVAPVTGILLGTEITAVFQDGAVSGSAGCNAYATTYSRDGSAISFQDVFATEKDCLDPAGIMEQERRYLDVLREVADARIYGHQLWLETGAGQALVFSTTNGAP